MTQSQIHHARLQRARLHHARLQRAIRTLIGLAAIVLLVGLLQSCASTPQSPTSVVAAPSSVAKVTQAELLAELDRLSKLEDETDPVLDVSPLRDNNAHDWLNEARTHFDAGRYVDSRNAVEQGLALAEDDPVLLQLRAELDLMAGDWKAASAGAYRAWQHSAQVGSLCRRQWATIALARRERGSLEASARAEAQRARCRVQAPPRF